MSTADRVRLPDDCTVGYIVEGLLGARLLRSSLFHSHLENLRRLPPADVLQQVRPAPRPGRASLPGSLASPCRPRGLAPLHPAARAAWPAPHPAA